MQLWQTSSSRRVVRRGRVQSQKRQSRECNESATSAEACPKCAKKSSGAQGLASSMFGPGPFWAHGLASTLRFSLSLSLSLCLSLSLSPLSLSLSFSFLLFPSHSLSIYIYIYLCIYTIWCTPPRTPSPPPPAWYPPLTPPWLDVTGPTLVKDKGHMCVSRFCCHMVGPWPARRRNSSDAAQGVRAPAVFANARDACECPRLWCGGAVNGKKRQALPLARALYDWYVRKVAVVSTRRGERSVFPSGRSRHGDGQGAGSATFDVSIRLPSRGLLRGCCGAWKTSTWHLPGWKPTCFGSQIQNGSRCRLNSRQKHRKAAAAQHCILLHIPAKETSPASLPISLSLASLRLCSSLAALVAVLSGRYKIGPKP